ncbi:hypothetical protein [Spirosoma utsteinense]|uniref:Uncharacterized protein n=1 Tax=Spirosoma utsteinense TaxID=2585773 RepID=A0ABR6WA48_9BACT|nr:hypothetical protein [Spirosoma utsteinense]MBC3793063.1 hypothetical protein [Spirosoma utsteinense]
MFLDQRKAEWLMSSAGTVPLQDSRFPNRPDKQHESNGEYR